MYVGYSDFDLSLYQSILKHLLFIGMSSIAESNILPEIPDLPWTNPKFKKKWAKKSAQTVNSEQYKQLREYIHRPYRKIDSEGVKCFYFPTYVIFKVKNITDFDFESLAASINGVLIIEIAVDYEDRFTINSDNIDTEVVRKKLEDIFDFQYVKAKVDEQNKDKYKNRKEQQKEEEDECPTFMKKYLFVQFNRDNPLRLPTKRIFEGQISRSTDSMEKDGPVTSIKWTIRKEFRISLAPGTVWEDLIAPFNILNFHLSLSFEDIDIDLEEQLIKFKFNCMKRVGNDSEQEKKRIFEQLLFTDDGSLGEYDLAETRLAVRCDKYQSEQVANDSSDAYRSYKVITFNIPFYKYPIMDSLTIFIPLVLITILTLFTFAQGPDFNDKIGNIATLMIVYVGLVPVINDSLPPTTSITLIDIVVYSQLIINILCLVRGYLIMNYDVDTFAGYSIWNDPFFIVSVVIAILAGIVLLLLLVYYCIMKSYFYNLEEADIDDSDRKRTHWVSPHMYNQARNVKTEISKVLV